MSECRACQYTGEIHKKAVEAEIKRLSQMKNVSLCTEEELNRRLEKCSSCEYLDINNVCLMCGCYVQIRALLRDSRCPAKNKSW